MTLVEERNQMRSVIQAGMIDNIILSDYRKNRESNLWRLSRNVEYLCEYILHLEEQLGYNTGLHQDQEETDEQTTIL